MTQTIAGTQNNEAMRIYYYATFAVATLCLYSAMVTAAYATNSVLGTSLCLVVQWMYGNIGRSIATLAVMIIGVGASLGKVTWGLAMTVAIGISIIFNAGTLVGLLTGIAGIGPNGGPYGCP